MSKVAIFKHTYLKRNTHKVLRQQNKLKQKKIKIFSLILIVAYRNIIIRTIITIIMKLCHINHCETTLYFKTHVLSENLTK